MHQLLKGLLAGAAAVALTAAAGVTSASAAQPVPVNRGQFSAVGDSFAAGVGNPTLPGAGSSLRSASAYPVLLAGKANKVTFAAATGATTTDVLAQVANIPGGARQITLTVGGNDIGFASLALACAADLTTPICQQAQAAAEAGQLALPGNLIAVLTALRAQAPDAHIYVTGYPLLFQPEPTPLGLSCPVPVLSSYDADNLYAADLLTDALNGVIEGVVSGLDPTGLVIEYVDVTGAEAFGGHGLCDGTGSYIFPPTFDPTNGMPLPSSLHPTPDGQVAYAEAIADAGFVTTALAG